MPSDARTLRWTKLHGPGCFGCRNGDWDCYALREVSMTGDWRDRRWKVNPETRSLAYLAEQGWTAWNVVSRKGIHAVDLFNFGDILAMRSHNGRCILCDAGGIHNLCAKWKDIGGDFLIVQATTAAHVNARVAKVLAEPMARTWLECEGLIQVHGWRYLKRQGEMVPVVREILLEDFDG